MWLYILLVVLGFFLLIFAVGFTLHLKIRKAITDISNSDAWTESRSAETLAKYGKLGLKPKDALPTLIDVLDPYHGGCAVMDAIGNYRAEAKAAVPKLIKLVDKYKSGDEATANAAMRTLGNIGPSANDAVPHLLEAYSEMENWFGKANAAEALEKIAPDVAQNNLGNWRESMSAAISHNLKTNKSALEDLNRCIDDLYRRT